MKIINKLLKRKKSKTEIVLNDLRETLRLQDEFIIALSRLSFVKPESLAREAYNREGNAEYLLKMSAEMTKLFKSKKK